MASSPFLIRERTQEILRGVAWPRNAADHAVAVYLSVQRIVLGCVTGAMCQCCRKIRAIGGVTAVHAVLAIDSSRSRNGSGVREASRLLNRGSGELPWFLQKETCAIGAGSSQFRTGGGFFPT